MLIGKIQRIAGIENILQDQHMASLNIDGNIPFDSHAAGGIRTLIR